MKGTLVLDELDEEDSYSAPVALKFAEDFSDPTLTEVTVWHIVRCQRCSQGVTEGPGRFGVSQRSRYCEEYWEIIDEYSEYEGHYAMRGNP